MKNYEKSCKVQGFLTLFCFDFDLESDTPFDFNICDIDLTVWFECMLAVSKFISLGKVACEMEDDFKL